MRPSYSANSPETPAKEAAIVVYRIGYGRPVYSIQTTVVFEVWFEGLKDRRARAWIQARIDRAEDGNFGDCKPVGEGEVQK